MRAAIVGSRRGLDWIAVSREIEVICKRPDVSVVVSGGAQGVDKLAEMIAKATGKKATVFPADWATHGRRAGYSRNITIVQESDEVFAFWDGASKGTKHTISISGRMGKPCHVWQDGKWRS